MKNKCRFLPVFLTTLLTPFSATLVFANDIPTVERVEYVLECMRDNPGPGREMIYKCSCVLDNLAKTFSHEQFVDGVTTAKALSISGERGSVLRDSEGAKAMAGAYRSALGDAKKSCFIK